MKGLIKLLPRIRLRAQFFFHKSISLVNAMPKDAAKSRAETVFQRKPSLHWSLAL